MAVSRTGYVGVVQVEEGLVDVAAAIDSRAIAAHQNSPGQIVRTILKENGFKELSAALRNASWKGTPALSRRRRLLGGTRLFILGDAAGYIEPFTGEGIAWAMLSGRLVTPIVERALSKWQKSLIREWEKLYYREIYSRQYLCRVVCRLLRYSVSTRLLVRLAGLNASWIEQIVESTNKPLDRKALVL
jgi:flavin-dependent dehydrogenase